ncbi:MAG TPA: nitroreductase family protein [Staphylococcus sp.]|uniref:nitroreductase family protein n=1 Tax=Mammaliicoccus vitulinus TaxID=71237 RepID=UPI000ED849CB|nr:nitroreductase family protein [Mammaliicoccus vitulinus]MBM6628946.1 nitroreductase family protein [Mammaliicoccus vitulinus]MBO3076024.1 nitroreductase family protein [Mammaliicoccus vitulinus]QJF25895.1 nitroreductase family protein [Mammaliicoccus vitulinus]HAL10554.1 nitroreductase family protein [Staphylococcus sp.]
MELTKVLENRRSVKSYEQYHLDRETIYNLLDKAALSPSAWNLQQWKVIVVDTDESKEKLYHAANKQIKIKEASATFIILGDLNAHETIGDVADDWIEHEHIPAENREGLIETVNRFFESETNKRDEAVRGASLFAMSLMLVSEDAGYATCPMIGFDKQSVIDAFNIEDNFIPAMLMTIGKGEMTNERASRLPASSFAKFE